MTLAETRTLPPGSDDEGIIGDEGPVRDVEVMSEPPEIDTTRFDGPPLIKLCGIRCQPIAVRLLFVLLVLTLLPVGALAICFLFQELRQNSPTVERMVNESKVMLKNSLQGVTSLGSRLGADIQSQIVR